LGEALYQCGYYNESAAAFLMALKINPSMLKAARWLMRLYELHLGKEEELQQLRSVYPHLQKGNYTLLAIVAGREGQMMEQRLLQESHANVQFYLPDDKITLDDAFLTQHANEVIILPALSLLELPLGFDFKVLILVDKGIEEKPSGNAVRSGRRLLQRRLEKIQVSLAREPQVIFHKLVIDTERPEDAIGETLTFLSNN
jgi:hypothetical protein